jgi:hypothetical protein
MSVSDIEDAVELLEGLLQIRDLCVKLTATQASKLFEILPHGRFISFHFFYLFISFIYFFSLFLLDTRLISQLEIIQQLFNNLSQDQLQYLCNQAQCKKERKKEIKK